MTTLNHLSAEALEGIVNFLDAFEITVLSFVVNTTARRKIQLQAVDRLEWTLYELDDEKAGKERLSAPRFVGELAVPRSLLEYRRVKEVNLSTYKLPHHAKLLPNEAHLRAWGDTLTSLKLESSHLLLSLLSSIGLSVFRPNFRKKYSENLMTLWRELELHDKLPVVPPTSDRWRNPRPPYLHPNPDPSTLTNPWLPLNKLLPNVTLLHLHQLASSNSVLGEVYTADYLAILWQQLPPHLEEFSHNVCMPFHPAMVKHLPRQLKTYISPHDGSKQAIPQLRTYDERSGESCGYLPQDKSQRAVFAALPATLETLMVPTSMIETKELVFLPPSITRLHAKTTYNQAHNRTEVVPPAEFHPSLRHLHYTYNGILDHLPINLQSWESIANGIPWDLRDVSRMPRGLTSLSLWSTLFDPKVGFSEFPQQLTALKIRILVDKSGGPQFLSYPVKREYRYLLTSTDLGSLPTSITHLSIDPHCKFARETPLDEKVTLDCIPCKKLTRLELSIPFIVRKTPTSTLPSLRTMGLLHARFSPEAIAGMTDLLKSNISLPSQLIDASIS